MDSIARSRAPVPKSLCAVADGNRGARVRSMADPRVQLEQYIYFASLQFLLGYIRPVL